MARLPMTLIGAEGHLLTYLLTYLLQDGRSIQSLRANALGSGVVPPLNPQFWSRGQNPWGWRIFIKQLRNSNICKHKRISLWNFSPTFESRIISIVAKCCQQSTDDRRLSITLSIQLCAQPDDVRRAVRWCQSADRHTHEPSHRHNRSPYPRLGQ